MEHRLTIEYMQELAKKQGGQCLSITYKNTTTKLQWRCDKGHVWQSTPACIIRGHWCHICRCGKNITIEIVKELAKEMGGICHSEKYVNAHGKLDFECVLGHKWKAAYYKIRAGRWCPICGVQIVANANKMKIGDLKVLAISRGGICKSDICYGHDVKLEWECINGHSWFAVPTSVKSGTWCPYCAGSYGERITRFVFESIFNDKFPTVRPKWLIHSTKPLELDGYNKKLKIAFEYQGQHHYREVGHYKMALKEVQKRDAIKVKICNEMGIKLIIIPYELDFEKLPSEIIRICVSNKLPVKTIGLELFDILNRYTLINKKKKERELMLNESLVSSENLNEPIAVSELVK